MIVTTNIARTVAFLKEQFEQSVYLANDPVQRKNRVEHALRVAAIGRQIAVEEGLNEEALVIGCLLHDLSYTERIVDGEASWINHGRRSVELARPWLTSSATAWPSTSTVKRSFPASQLSWR